MLYNILGGRVLCYVSLLLFNIVCHLLYVHVYLCVEEAEYFVCFHPVNGQSKRSLLTNFNHGPGLYVSVSGEVCSCLYFWGEEGEM